MDIESQTMTAMGQDWNVAVLGPADAERTILLCNGIGASVETIGPFVDHFKRTRLIAFDVPGVGRSPTPFSPYRFSNLTRMLNNILDQLGVGKVDVFGVSWGGGLAQQFAIDFQDRCNTLILAATAPGMIMVPGNINVLSKMATPKRYTDPEYMLKVGAEIYGGEVAFNQELLKDHAMAMKAGDTRGYLYQLLAGAGWTSYFQLPKVKLPTLILMGEDDPLVPPVNGRILASRLPNATLEMVSCGHMFVLTQAEQIADRIEEFIHEDAMVDG
ncbi:poly(3-hydroxyalkanoate) depolymerase [Ruegeria halocynthiae]|uniref:poly(3-hydroxyalkanoate) depolymerase n=1 Tax=Ruegeria halocynthiae TaxID=985054 RepID=UPI000A99D129|nr:poly(3-hydroxyalkanoate) depolymerase [Ruegeria halocynthiae]